MIGDNEFGYGGFTFSWGDHICAIFENHEQQMRVMIPFFATGLRAGHRCLWIGPADSAGKLRDGLMSIGADLPTLEASGQLVVISDLAFYLSGGVFEAERTLALLRILLDDARREGYAVTRAAGDLSWLGTRPLDPGLWEAYEARMTREIACLPMVVVCQYNARQLGGVILVKALQTHPIVIIGDTIHQNPFYVAEEDTPPAEVH